LFVLVVAGCGSKKDEATEKNTKQGGAVEQIKKRGKLVVGVKNDTNLFGLKNPSTGQVEGFDVDVAKALAKKILG
ncbi:glutamine ABC transporter substrate-binding protein GlnH, partial [Bacillus sp. D-CC]